jgi:ribosome biogenesis GTPase
MKRQDRIEKKTREATRLAAAGENSQDGGDGNSEANPAQATGRIIAAHGRHYQVELADGTVRQCYPRGKRTGAAVGDNVSVTLQGRDEGALDAILPRKNLLYRSDEMRSKQFAANVDRLFVVVAVQPTFSDDLAGRALTGAWSAGIEPFIVLNKVDLGQGLPEARAKLAPLAALGVPILEVSAQDTQAACALLKPYLADRVSLLLGQSGMGKSTLLNALVPDAGAATREHSEALDMGKHTTTSTRLYHLPGGGGIIDSPGFQAFGLQHLGSADIVRGFPEFAQYLSQCRFYNCEHLHEPGCGVLQALHEGRIDPARHALYKRILEENAAQSRY